MPKLLPSRTKFRKVHKGRVRGVASRGNKVSFGEFGIQSLTRGRMTSNQIEAARVAINRHLKRKGKVWIRVFPHKPVTKKPAETRQGKGKGPVDHWVAVIKPGHVLFEIAGCSLTLAREALGLADENIRAKRTFSPRTSEKAQRFGRRIIATSGSQANGSGRKASPFKNDSSRSCSCPHGFKGPIPDKVKLSS